MKFSKERIIVVLIFIIAIFSRLYLWPNAIDDINCDEAMTAINAKAIAETGKDMYGTSLPVYFEAWLNGGQSALLTYLMALSIKAFGFSTFSIRLPMLIISIISLFVFYKLMDIIFDNKNITTITLFILAINPWHIMQSIWSLDCNMFPHFMLISTYLLVKGMKNQKMGYVYLSMIFFGITTYSYGIALYVIPIFLIIYMLIALRNKTINWKNLIISASIVTIIALPLIIMTILNLFNLDNFKIGPITIQKFEYFTRTSDIILFSNNILKQMCINLKSLFKILILNQDGLEWNSIENIGAIYLGSIIFAIIGLLPLVKDKTIDKESKNIVLIWVTVACLTGIFINNVNINRLNIIWYPIIILIGFGIYQVAETFNFNKILLSFIIVIYSIAFTIFNVNFYNIHIEKIKNSNTWSKGFKDVALYAIESNKNIIIDTEILNSDKNIIFSIYLFNYDFKEYGFITRDILLENYLGISNDTAIKTIAKNKRVRFKKFDNDILDNCIYINYKSNEEMEIDNEEYELKEFNCYYTITKY